MRQKKFLPVVSLILCFLLLFSMPMPVHATQQNSDSSGSLYEITTSLTTYVNNVVGGNGNDKHNKEKGNNQVELGTGNQIRAGNAGAYVGYGDVSNGFKGFIVSNANQGESGSTYEAWEGVIEASGEGTNAAYQYARYGRTLTDAGLDTQSARIAPLSVIAGGLSMVSYFVSEMIPLFFNITVKLLKLLNPFQYLVQSANSIVANSQGVRMADQAAQQEWSLAHTVVEPLAKWISNLFDALYDVSVMIIVPAFVAVFALAVLVGRKSAGSEATKLLKRVFFIFAGIPALACLYTATLNNLGNVVEYKPAASRLMSASYMDFGAWVDHSRLSPYSNISAWGGHPGQIYIESSPKGDDGATTKGGAASAKMMRNLRSTVLELNEINEAVPKTLGTLSATDTHASLSGGLWNSNAGKGFAGSDADLNEQVLVGDTNGNGKEDSGEHVSVAATDESFKRESDIAALIYTFAQGDFYTASGYAAKTAKDLKDNAGSDLGYAGDTSDSSVHTMLTMTDQPSDWMNRESDDNNAIWNAQNNSNIKWADKPYNIFVDGYLETSNTDSETMTWTADGTKQGLSHLSMYNYLLTTFNESSITTYSPQKAISGYTIYGHTTVSLIGSGAFRFFFWLNSLVCIGVLAIIGFAFSITLLITDVKLGLKVLTSIPFAMLGIMTGIAQVCIYVFMMIAEIIGTIFLYSFVSELFIIFANMAETLVGQSQGLNYNAIIGGRFAMSGLSILPDAVFNMKGSVLFGLAFAIVVMGFVCGMMLRYREVICYGWSYMSQKAYLYAALTDDVRDVLEDAFKNRNRERQSLPVLLSFSSEF